MTKFFGFGKESSHGPERAPTRYFRVITSDMPCECGHTNAQHGYIDGFWDGSPTTEPCGECDCQDFDPAPREGR